MMLYFKVFCKNNDCDKFKISIWNVKVNIGSD